MLASRRGTRYDREMADASVQRRARTRARVLGALAGVCATLAAALLVGVSRVHLTDITVGIVVGGWVAAAVLGLAAFLVGVFALSYWATATK